MGGGKYVCHVFAEYKVSIKRPSDLELEGPTVDSITQTFNGNPKRFELSGYEGITLLITCILDSRGLARFVYHNTRKL